VELSRSSRKEQHHVLRAARLHAQPHTIRKRFECIEVAGSTDDRDARTRLDAQLLREWCSRIPRRHTGAVKRAWSPWSIGAHHLVLPGFTERRQRTARARCFFSKDEERGEPRPLPRNASALASTTRDGCARWAPHGRASSARGSTSRSTTRFETTRAPQRETVTGRPLPLGNHLD